MVFSKTPVDLINSLQIGSIVYDVTVFFEDSREGDAMVPCDINVVKYSVIDFPNKRDNMDTNLAYRYAMTIMGEPNGSHCLAQHSFQANNRNMFMLTENCFYRFEHGVLSLYFIL